MEDRPPEATYPRLTVTQAARVKRCHRTQVLRAIWAKTLRAERQGCYWYVLRDAALEAWQPLDLRTPEGRTARASVAARAMHRGRG